MPDIGHVLSARDLWKRFCETKNDFDGDAQESFIQIVAPILAALADARADAERYRWIKAQATSSFHEEDTSEEAQEAWKYVMTNDNDSAEMDYAIDAAIAKATK